MWAPTHYALTNVEQSMVWIKEKEYFDSLHFANPEIKEIWEPVYFCDTVGDARRKVAKEKGIYLPWIYLDEP